MQRQYIWRQPGAFSIFALLLASPVSALPPATTPSFFDDFDADHAADWVVNDGPTDEWSDFFFDYGTVGIPPAPHSMGGTTRGLKLQANLYSAEFGGFSVSPAVSPIPAGYDGDYILKFDWWTNYIGNESTGISLGASGSTTLSTFGILTSGSFANFAGSADSVFFAATGDGGTAADYRAYSSERPVSYQIPPIIPEDEHATHIAGSRNSSAPYFVSNFPGGASPPVLQQAMFPQTQFGSTPPGSMGFAWHEVTIDKRGDLVTWLVDGVPLIAVDVADIVVPTGGTNILLGNADINAGINPHPDFPFLQFALFDNVQVVPEPAPAALACIAAAARCCRRRRSNSQV